MDAVLRRPGPKQPMRVYVSAVSVVPVEVSCVVVLEGYRYGLSRRVSGLSLCSHPGNQLMYMLWPSDLLSLPRLWILLLTSCMRCFVLRGVCVCVFGFGILLLRQRKRNRRLALAFA
mmetsp:Transcript_25389/g.73314  ORF Transcript_25389/g.73314 Transcript_25389/m.73314 type:complete len:117 (+) Transcript_25389:817-1167(+)